MKITVRNAALCLLLTEASAFTAPQVPASISKYAAGSSTNLQMVKENERFMADSLKAFAVAATVLALNVGSPAFADTSVQVPQGQDLFSSSSIQIADTIKTMDFSMPSSYDAISNVKKNSIDALTQEENLLTGKVVKKTSKTTTERTGTEPKMTAEERKANKEALEAEKAAEKEATAAENAAIAAEKQAERDILAKERATEREVAKKEEAAAKKVKDEARARADAAKEERAKESQSDGYEYVDAGLPSYGDSTSKKAKNGFSIR
jgi:hypothetical protein